MLRRHRDVATGTSMRPTSLRRCSNVLAGTLKRLKHMRSRGSLLHVTQKKLAPFSDYNLNVPDHAATSS